MMIKLLVFVFCYSTAIALTSPSLQTSQEQLGEAATLPIFLGKSYDLLNGNIMSRGVDPGFMHDLFHFTYNKKQITEDGKYLVPDGVSHYLLSACSFASDSLVFRGTKSYQDHISQKAELKGGYKGLIFKAAFSASQGYQKMQKDTSQSKKSIIHATAECEAYKLEMNIFKISNLSSNFIQGVKESFKSGDWTKFIGQFGTHYVYDITQQQCTRTQCQYGQSCTTLDNCFSMSTRSITKRQKYHSMQAQMTTVKIEIARILQQICRSHLQQQMISSKLHSQVEMEGVFSHLGLIRLPLLLKSLLLAYRFVNFQILQGNEVKSVYSAKVGSNSASAVSCNVPAGQFITQIQYYSTMCKLQLLSPINHQVTQIWSSHWYLSPCKFTQWLSDYRNVWKIRHGCSSAWLYLSKYYIPFRRAIGRAENIKDNLLSQKQSSFKPTHKIYLFAQDLLILLLTLKMQSSNQVNLSITDGCNNNYTIQYPKVPHFFYRGVRPIESSSGFYSGGPDVSYNFQLPQQVLEIQKLLHQACNDKKNVVKDRCKGTSVLMDKKKGLSVNMSQGQKFFKLETKLQEIKSKGKVHIETHQKNAKLNHW